MTGGCSGFGRERTRCRRAVLAPCLGWLVVALSLVACGPSDDAAKAGLVERVEAGEADAALRWFKQTRIGRTDEGRVEGAQLLADSGATVEALALLPESAPAPAWLARACVERMEAVVEAQGEAFQPEDFGPAAAWNACARREDRWRNGAPVAAAWVRFRLRGDYVLRTLQELQGYGGEGNQALLARLHREAAAMEGVGIVEQAWRHIRAYLAHPTDEAHAALERTLVSLAESVVESDPQAAFSVAEFLYTREVEGFTPSAQGRSDGMHVARVASLDLIADSLASAHRTRATADDPDHAFWNPEVGHFVFPPATEEDREAQLRDFFYRRARLPEPETPIRVSRLFSECATPEEPCIVSFRDLAVARANHLLWVERRLRDAEGAP